MSLSHNTFESLAPGAHAFDSDGVTQRYHVYGSGPVCLAHPGGPGIGWEYLRTPELEKRLAMVYIEALGTGESGRLPTHPNARIAHDRRTFPLRPARRSTGRRPGSARQPDEEGESCLRDCTVRLP